MQENLLGTDKALGYAIVHEMYREQEFTKIYEMYVDDIYRLCFSFMKNHMDAEDAVQETFMKYYHSGKDFEDEGHLKAWLIVTASNHCKNLLKQWWRKGQNLENYQEAVGEGGQMVDEMMELVMKLPWKYKTAVYLYYYEGYDSREIARMLKKPDSTIRTYLQRARKLLKKELES